MDSRNTLKYYNEPEWTGTKKIKNIKYIEEEQKFQCILQNGENVTIYIESGVPMVPLDLHPDSHRSLAVFL